MNETRKNLISAIASEKRVLESLRNSAYWGDVECCRAIEPCKERIAKLRNELWNEDKKGENVLDDYAEYFRLDLNIPESEEMQKHIARKDRHKMHREIKHRMYAERIARRKAKKGA